MIELTIADHIIITLKSRYSWFGNMISKMDVSTKKVLREEWGNILNAYDDVDMHYALQQDSNSGIFASKMEPFFILKKLKSLCDERAMGSITDKISSRSLLAEYNAEYDDLLKTTSKKGFKNLTKDEWEHYRKEMLRLGTLIASEEIKAKRGH